MGSERSPSPGWQAHPNLRARPHAPAAARGRLQKAIARCFHTHGPDVSAAVIYDWTQRWPDGRRHRWSTMRILREVCEQIGRGSTRGRPYIWRLQSQRSVANPVASEEIT
jgi:hypothetical protein